MNTPNRRHFLKGAFALGCSAAASPIMTPVTLAAAPGDNRLVIIILRGAMDGIGVFQPQGDRDFAALRPTIAVRETEGLIPLDDRFGMHPRLAPLRPLWQSGQLAVAHAVSTPYRGKRSHFDGQDILEAGAGQVGARRSGWLNRALDRIGGPAAENALAVGREDMLLMRGDRLVRSWSPDAELELKNDERALLRMIYAHDPLFAQAVDAAEDLSALGGGDAAGQGAGAVARYAAGRLNAEARIAAFSLGGWDTHARQDRALNRPLDALAEAITTLHQTLGKNWSETMVIAMTEFGRTARENGGRGTDHGTGGAAILAGGALKGGRMFGEWPGLREADLYEGRDLMPTRDVRAYPAFALAALYGLDRTALERDIFPGLDMGQDPGFIA